MSAAPGPYQAFGNKVKAQDHGRWYTVADCRQPLFTREAQMMGASRLARCFNACDGIRDPVEFIAAARDALAFVESFTGHGVREQPRPIALDAHGNFSAEKIATMMRAAVAGVTP